MFAHQLASSSLKQRSRLALPLATAFALAIAAPLAAAPVINEIMYRPGSTYPENPADEFIEIHNPDSTPADLSGWAITRGVDFIFPAGTTLPVGGYLVVAANPGALRATGVSGTILGPWKSGATLSNRGEKVTLSMPSTTAGEWTTIDEVNYADEGDWALRARETTFGGWTWSTGANGEGRSLERRNPKFAIDNGQNWGASSAAGGSPGVANSLLSSNIAPVIHDVKHSPAVPMSGDPVRIETRLTDESSAGSLSATLYWRDATSSKPGAFQTVALVADGGGRFSVTLNPMANKTVVEFYVSATDGTNTRTWPAPTAEGQNANAVYQVDDEIIRGSASTYRLVLTGAEHAAFEEINAQRPSPGVAASNRMFNATVIVSTPGGTDDAIRYRASIRFRGESSRGQAVKGMRISLPTDDRLDGISDFNLIPRYSWTHFLGMRLVRAAGLAAPDVNTVEVRRNAVEYNSPGSNNDRWLRIDDINGDYADRNWPNAVDAQVYRKERGTVSYWNSTPAAPANPDDRWGGWSKQNQHALNDWSDVMQFSKHWQEVAAAHFTGAEAGNVAAGTWDKTPFTDAEIATLSEVADFDQLARWFALMTVLQNSEPNVSNGGDDDYAAAFVSDGSHRRLQLLPYDLDNIFGLGDERKGPTEFGLFPMTEVRESSPPGGGSPGGGTPGTPPGGGTPGTPPPGGSTTPPPGGPGGTPGTPGSFKPLLPLFGDKDNSGNATFRAKYITHIRELLGGMLDADTSAGGTPAFHAFIDNHIGDWVSAEARNDVKTFMATRQKHLLDLIGAPKIPPAAATSTATFAATAAPTLRISEVLAININAHANGSTRPDVIELYNAGTTAIDLAGKSLSDDSAEPRKYVFPSGTTIAGGGYLTVYADTATSAPGLHTGFSLDAEGDQVRLHDTTASGGALLDAITFGFQIPDHSISRTGADATMWALTTPTLGAVNGSALATGSASALRLNEWAGNIEFRTDHDFIELYNPATQPVALGGVRLTDDRTNYPSRFPFPALSYIAPRGFLVLYGADFGFSLDGDHDFLFLLGENGALIDQADSVSQPDDQSTGRTTDGGGTWAPFAVPTPGISNTTTLPATHRALLDDLRITELMYQPSASNNASDYEFIELQNTGKTTLDLSGVRFTNGLNYTFPSGTRLAAGAFIVVAKKRDAFLSRYASAATTLAPGEFTGALDNNGENIALTLPDPWYVHILRFRYEPSWQPQASGPGHSLVVRAPAVTPARDYGRAATWRASAAQHGNPGAADHGGVAVALSQSSTTLTTGQGASTTFAVNISGVTNATVQWQRLVDGVWINVPFATTASYTITSTQPSNAGAYRALVTANGSTLVSDTIILVVDTTAPATPAIRIVNLSSRAYLQSAAEPVLPGFVITGTGSKRVLLRAVGPTLSSFGVSNPVADPQIALKRWNATTSAYIDVTSNDNWSASGAASNISSVASSVGAFALSSNSLDAAMVVVLEPGQYSAVATGGSTGSGVVLVELYDASAETTTSQLGNIATRSFVGSGENIIAAGFVIVGTGTKTILVRGVGPMLATFGVANPLADPQIAVFRGSEQLFQNNDWSSAENSSAIATAATQVGAFVLPAGGKDAALLLTLPAGTYTVQLRGEGTSTGVALVEVYEVK
jgi:hypothetical protein